MAKEEFKSIETEGAAEWIYFAVMANHSKNDVVEVIETALDSAFSEEPIITEKDIDEAMDDNLELAKSSYEQGDITKEEYDKWSQESMNRDLVKQELIEANGGGG